MGRKHSLLPLSCSPAAAVICFIPCLNGNELSCSRTTSVIAPLLAVNASLLFTSVVAVQRNQSLVSLYPTIQIIWDSSPSHVSTVIMEVQDIHISLLCVVRSENGRNAISEARAQHAPHVFPPPRRVTHTEGIHHALFKLLILPAISGRGRLLPDIEAGTLN